MAKTRGRKTTLDSVAIAAGSALGRLAQRIDSLTKQREAITTEIQRYARQAETALRGLAAGKNPFAGAAGTVAPRKRRKMSVAARRKIAEDVPAVVQRNAAVIEAYLGGSHVAS